MGDEYSKTLKSLDIQSIPQETLYSTLKSMEYEHQRRLEIYTTWRVNFLDFFKLWRPLTEGCPEDLLKPFDIPVVYYDTKFTDESRILQ